MWYIFIVLNYMLCANADIAAVSINDILVKTQRANTDIFGAIGTYYYNENELAKVVCQSSDAGQMKFRVKDEPNLTSFVIGKAITMFIKLRTEPDGKYIDCVHNKTGLVSIVRIMMQPRKTAQYNDTWKIEINQMPWQPRPKIITHNYVFGEMVHVSCQGETAGSGFTRAFATGKESPLSLICPSPVINNSTQIKFHEMNTDGLQSNKILFVYAYSIDRNVIHYEYAEKDNLNVKWTVAIHAGKSNEFNVYWKDKSVTSFPILDSTNKTVIKMLVPTISPRYDDDRSVIKFMLSTTDAKQSTHREIWVVLRRKTNSSHLDEMKNETIDVGVVTQLGLYIAIGVGGVIVVICLILILWYIIRNKSKRAKNESSDQYYGNVPNEGSAAPTAPRWDTCAQTVDTNMDTLHLYAQPVPKRLRKAKLPNDTYVNVASNSKIEELYCDAETYANSKF